VVGADTRTPRPRVVWHVQCRLVDVLAGSPNQPRKVRDDNRVRNTPIQTAPLRLSVMLSHTAMLNSLQLVHMTEANLRVLLSEVFAR
jgi:hypothetical protein